MRYTKFSLATLVLLLSTLSFGWNCPSGQIRQQAPSGTPTTTPFYDVVEGIAFICVPSVPPVDPKPSTQTQNQTQSQNQNQSATATSGSSSNSTSGASSTATGGKSSSTSTAQGGNVQDSGNSSNRNTNIAQGGKGGQGGQGGKGGSSFQTQSSVSSATGNGVGNGNNSNNYESSTVVESSKIPVNTAFAPSQFPTVGCYKTYSGGAQTQAFGISLGGGKIDENCAVLEAAGRARNILAYCKVYVSNKYVKRAGVSLADCLHQEQVAPVLPPPIVTEPVQPTIIVVPQASAPVPTVPTVPSTTLAGTCLVLDNICKSELDDANNWHKQSDGVIVIYGSLTTYRVANAMRTYLTKAGVPSEAIRIEMAQHGGTEVGLAYLQQ